MALSQNEDFAIWYIRTSYLNNVQDGIAERLININSSVLNTPGFRTAGWTVDSTRRTYSPPIPTAIHSEYFQASPALIRTESHDNEVEEGGMVTGRTSNDTVGPSINVKRRRRKEQIDDDDSSDLSDESDDDEDIGQRAAQQIRFAKMPARDRADSSPLQNPITTGQSRDVLTAENVAAANRRRGSSLSAVEAVKARARADTTTSSDMSSENEIAPAYFARRHLGARKGQKTRFLEDAIVQENEKAVHFTDRLLPEDEFDAGSIDSDLSSDLDEVIGSNSLLASMDKQLLPTSSPSIPTIANDEVQSESPKKTRPLTDLTILPPPRPISYIQPASLLSSALNAQKSTPKNPIQKFAALSGKGSPNPLWIRIFAPFSKDKQRSIDMPLARTSEEGMQVIVAEAIGLALWRYCEEKREPSLEQDVLNVNKWALRMVEDGEVDFDFPALQRTKPVTDFTSNNNRGARGRSRERPYDEFALVEASGREFEANVRATPTFSPMQSEMSSEPTVSGPIGLNVSNVTAPRAQAVPRPSMLATAQPFASAIGNTSVTPADQPAPAAAQSTPRLGVTKTVRIRYFDLDTSAQSTTMEVSIDSYIAEILDHVCKRWNFDKAIFVLRVAGTNTVAPLDRTVEALGPRSDLELVRKRFGATPIGQPGSPGGSSPSAPLLLDALDYRRGKRGQTTQHPLAQKEDLMTSANNFKKYYVIRKQLTSFAASNQRVLIFDGDFLHNMPADTGKIGDAHAKTNSFAFGDLLKCKVSTKHSKIIRLFVRRSSESKRYDFEARTAGEAQEIVDEIVKEMQLARKT